MCIICVSKSGVRQPSDITLRAMFRRNPHGAGYMYARDGKVTIHKGFMNIEDFLAAVHAEQFTPQDSVVYHFRISTQAGVNAPMTHPFPLSNQLRMMRSLDLPLRRRTQRNHPADLRPGQQALQRHSHFHHRLPLQNHPQESRPQRPGYTGAHLATGQVQVRHHGQLRVRRNGRTLHRRPRPALQQRQLPNRLVVLSRQLSNQELPPAGGFSCCARFPHVGACRAFKSRAGKASSSAVLAAHAPTSGATQARKERALHDEKSAGQIA